MYILTFKFTASSIMSMFVDVIKSAVAVVVKDGGFQLASVPFLPLPHSTLPPNWWNG